MKFIANILFLTAFFSTAQGNSILHLKGRIVSFDPNEVTLETGKSIYKIDRRSLPKNESDQITKSGIVTTLNVPMTAIKTVKNLPKK